MASDEYDDLLREVVRRGRFRSADVALKAALDAYNDARPFILDGPEDRALRAKAVGKHKSKRAAEIAALRCYLNRLPR